jgi:hypothetical protein
VELRGLGVPVSREEGSTRPCERGWRDHSRPVHGPAVSPDRSVSIIRTVQVHDPTSRPQISWYLHWALEYSSFAIAYDSFAWP